jgi:hypothetical protein
VRLKLYLSKSSRRLQRYEAVREKVVVRARKASRFLKDGEDWGLEMEVRGFVGPGGKRPEAMQMDEQQMRVPRNWTGSAPCRPQLREGKGGGEGGLPLLAIRQGHPLAGHLFCVREIHTPIIRPFCFCCPPGATTANCFGLGPTLCSSSNLQQHRHRQRSAT